MIFFSIIGALIGAGFASGQEIYLFFYRYGLYGVFGIALCSLLIGIIIYKVLKTTCKYNIDNYKDFLKLIFKSNESKRKYINTSYIMNIIVNLFLLICFFIMIAGFGAYFKQEFNINSFIGSSILSLICFIIFMMDIKGVTKVNSIVVPVLILFILLIGINNLSLLNISDLQDKVNIKENIINNWFVQSIIYASYNLLLVIPLLVNLKRYVKSDKQIISVSVLSSIVLFLLAISIYIILDTVNDFAGIEMPAVYAISNISTFLRNLYGIVILLSILTTSISLGISFLEDVVKNKNLFPHIAGIMCITGVLVSNFGFSNLVNLLFPMFGFLGLFKIGTVLFLKT